MKNVRLTPVQRLAADRVLAGLAVGDVIVLRGKPRSGKSRILQTVHAAMGGALLDLREFIERRKPSALEDAVFFMMEDALARHAMVFVDDLHLITNRDGSGALLLDAAFTSLLGDAAGQRKKLVFATGADAPWPIRRRAVVCST